MFVQKKGKKCKERIEFEEEKQIPPAPQFKHTCPCSDWTPVDSNLYEM